MKALKNIGMILLITLIILFSLYFINSCSSIFNSFQLTDSLINDSIFVNRDGNKQVSFYYGHGRFDTKEDAFEFSYELDFNFIYCIDNETNETVKTFYALDENKLYNQNSNIYFYRVGGKYEA